jgi:LysR family glycine cleavage system transcriptional activator
MSRRLPPLRALRAFEAAARQMSFARAADELAVTPAAVSQQIKLLEDTLGLALFHRSPHLALTEGAAAALPLFTDAFDRLERAVERLRQGRRGGPLVVSVPPFFAARWLVPRLERFYDRHADIDLRLSASRRLVDFAVDDVDCAIRYGAGRYPGLHAERLWVEEVVAVAAPRLAARLAQPADLLGCTLLVNQNTGWDRTFPDWRSWLAAAGVEAGDGLRLKPFDETALIIEAAVAGLGVALIWRSLVGDDIKAGRLAQVFPARPLDNAFHLVCPPTRLEWPKVAAFRAWVLEEAGGTTARA